MSAKQIMDMIAPNSQWKVIELKGKSINAGNFSLVFGQLRLKSVCLYVLQGS
jgi:hypothetical protein